MSRDQDEDRPQWRDGDDDPEERPEWEEIEPEEEPTERGGVLGGTAPLARIVFGVVLVALIVTTVLALTGGLRRWFGG